MKFQFEFGDSGKSEQELPEGDSLRLLILGNFSGTELRHVGTPLRVDIDTIDSIMSAIAPQITLESGLNYEITCRDDFHPDQIIHKIPQLSDMLSSLRRLEDPMTFVAEQRRLGFSQDDVLNFERQDASKSYESTSTPNSASSLLDQILDHSSPSIASGSSSKTSGGLPSEFIDALVTPFVVPSETESQRQIAAQHATNLALRLRNLLHAPIFQELEATWRGLNWLLQQLTAQSNVEVWIMDASWSALQIDLLGPDATPRTSLTRRALVEGSSLGDPWSVVAGLYSFSTSASDLTLLQMLGIMSTMAGAPFLSAAAPELAGYASFDGTSNRDERVSNQQIHPAWETLRMDPSAKRIGLAVPRFLSRLPYGRDSVPLESFDFEELESNFHHGDLLWGNPAIVSSYFLMQQLADRDFGSGAPLEVDDMPVLVLGRGSDAKLVPCVEYRLTDHEAIDLIRAGFMPLTSRAKSASIRLCRLQSAANPPTELVES